MDQGQGFIACGPRTGINCLYVKVFFLLKDAKFSFSDTTVYKVTGKETTEVVRSHFLLLETQYIT